MKRLTHTVPPETGLSTEERSRSSTIMAAGERGKEDIMESIKARAVNTWLEKMEKYCRLHERNNIKRKVSKVIILSIYRRTYESGKFIRNLEDLQLKLVAEIGQRFLDKTLRKALFDISTNFIKTNPDCPIKIRSCGQLIFRDFNTAIREETYHPTITVHRTRLILEGEIAIVLQERVKGNEKGGVIEIPGQYSGKLVTLVIYRD